MMPLVKVKVAPYDRFAVHKVAVIKRDYCMRFAKPIKLTVCNIPVLHRVILAWTHIDDAIGLDMIHVPRTRPVTE